MRFAYILTALTYILTALTYILTALTNQARPAEGGIGFRSSVWPHQAQTEGRKHRRCFHIPHGGGAKPRRRGGFASAAAAAVRAPAAPPERRLRSAFLLTSLTNQSDEPVVRTSQKDQASC